MKPSKKLALAVLATALTLSASAAIARPVDQAHVTVTYSDLNLDREAGVNALYRRIASAARRVCGQAEPRSTSQVAAVRACRSDALDGAVASVDHAELTKLHMAKTGRDASHSVAKRE